MKKKVFIPPPPNYVSVPLRSQQPSISTFSNSGAVFNANQPSNSSLSYSVAPCDANQPSTSFLSYSDASLGANQWCKKSILKLYLTKSIINDGKTTRNKVKSMD